MYKSVRRIRKEKKRNVDSSGSPPIRGDAKGFRARDRPEIETGKKRQTRSKKRRGHVVDIDPETRRCSAERRRGKKEGEREGDTLRDSRVSVGGGEGGGGGLHSRSAI